MKDFLNFIKLNSPYYRDLWQEQTLDLASLPIVDQEKFWDANDWDHNQLLTAPMNDGVVFKSGGTTGRPKFSIYTKNEWEEFTKIFGEGMSSVISAGDRIGNLFYAGELYASFLFINKSLEHCPVGALTFPIAGGTELDECFKIIKSYKVNVLAGVPTTFLRLAQFLKEQKLVLPLEKLLYGGETLFDDQKDLLMQAFDCPQIHSIGYASVDAGHLGASAPELGARIHRVLPKTIMQIVDDEGNLIETPNVSGRLLMTNLSRTLMPIVRYPVGDLACWHEVGENFEILGRADEGARIGPVTVNRDDIAAIFSELSASVNFQLIIKRHEGKDQLVVQVDGKLDCDKAEDLLLKRRKMLHDALLQELVARPLFIQVKELERNKRTGKLKLVIDQRF